MIKDANIETVNNTHVIFPSQLPHYLYENIFFSKSHLTHMLQL